MSSSRPQEANSALLLAVLMLLAGCARPAVPEHPRQASFEPPGGLDVGSTLAVYPGALDLMNRYLSVVVLVDTTATSLGCSGVLVTPSAVLTAAHCTCAKRAFTPSDREKVEEHLVQTVSSDITDEQKEQMAAWKIGVLGNARTIADSSRCLVRPIVLVISYVGAPVRSVPKEYQVSAVHPHPRFLSLDDHRDLGSKRAPRKSKP